MNGGFGPPVGSDRGTAPIDIRPLITRHRLRKRRQRKAAGLLTGASIALGVAALRSPPAIAQSRPAAAPACVAPGFSPASAAPGS